MSWEMSLLYFFRWNFTPFLQKEPHHSAKFQTSDCSGENSPNLYFDRLLLRKAYKVSAKKSMEEICLMIPRVVQNLKKNLFFVSKMTRIWWMLIWALRSLKHFHFDWFSLCKICNVWLKKVQRGYILWHWKVMQNLKQNWLVVWKMTRNLANFYQNTWKCQNWFFHGILLSKVEDAWAINLQRRCK